MSTFTSVPPGGLEHLVEAATALTQLNSVPAKSPSKVVSDDEKGALPASRREIFPQRLMAILNDETLSEAITWLPHGKSFVIIRPDVFMLQILPKYLPAVDARASTKYPSFTRKLNRWGFRQATRGPDTGSFHHPLFRKDRPELCLDMVCQRSRAKAEKKKPVATPANNGNTVVPLTKAALETHCPASTNKPATVSDDSRSVTSSSSFAAGGTISTDSKLVEETLRRRDEIERMKVAKALLYESYLKAVRGD